MAFLNGNTFIKTTIEESSPSIGYHIPDKTDCPTIMIDEIPPIDFSLHIEPNSIPTAIKNRDVTKLKRIAGIMSKVKIYVSITPPIIKNKIDWIIVIGSIAIVYEKINSYDFVFVTYNLVKKDVFLSVEIRIPVNNVRKLCENTAIPGARYLISN